MDDGARRRIAANLFGDGVERAARFVDLLEQHGVERGVIGPREVDRLWERHVLNCAVVGDLLADGESVLDVGSGGGFPGVPLALCRPGVDFVLIEPMERRIAWLKEVVGTLELTNVEVVRGRAEDLVGVTNADVVTSRAVAPLAKLSRWCLPLTRRGGRMLALKGASAADEVERDRYAVRKAGGADIEIVQCGVGVLLTATTVVAVRKRS